MAVIEGITKINGVPTSCNVYLYQVDTGELTSAVISAPDTGYYLFDQVPSNTQFTVAATSIPSILGIAPQMSSRFELPGPLGDPYWTNVVVLLNLDGSLENMAGVNFTASPTALTYVDGRIGNALQFTGNGSQWALCEILPEMELSGELFTIEFFAKLTPQSTGSRVPLSYGQGNGRDLGWWINLNTGGVRFIQSSNGYGSNTSSAGASMPPTLDTTEWFHIAICRSAGGDTLFFIDGELISTGNLPESWNISNTGLSVGRLNYSSYTYPFIGSIDGVRITKGVSRYTESFNPPVDPFPTSAD